MSTPAIQTFTVKRMIGGKQYHRDEDRIHAESWAEAEYLLEFGRHYGMYDSTCEIVGILVEEVEVPDDFIKALLN